MKSGHQALTGIQRPQGIDAALKADIKVQIVRVGDMLSQDRQGKIMAGADSQNLMLLVARHGDDLRKIRTQGLDMRLHAQADATFSPQQFFGKRCQSRTPALGPVDHRLTQRLLPFS